MTEGASSHRSGLYGLCQDRQWENRSLRVASAAEALRGPIWHLLLGAHPYQVSAVNTTRRRTAVGVTLSVPQLPLVFSTHDVNVMSCRELAYQIAEQFRVLGKPLGVRDCIIVGGMGNDAAFISVY